MTMKILVGLGNPGPKYQNNRHNVGHMFVDFVNEQVKSQKLKVKSFDAKFIKTNCFMNVSGKFVSSCVTRYKIQVSRDLYVVHDDLDISFGKFKIQFGNGPKLHNGILSIEDELGTNDFWRVRIGADARKPEDRIDGETYCLEDFTSEERKQLQTVFKNIYKQIAQ